MHSLPLELIGEIVGVDRLVYHPLVLACPTFARSLTLGDRLDFAEKFGYDCRVDKNYGYHRIVWRLDGMYHRTDGPAVDMAIGAKYWYIHGKEHRTDGPAIENADGSKRWYIDDKLHRIDGPAIENADGSKRWYIDDKLHRIDGPAIENTDGSVGWYLDGIRMSEADYYGTISDRTP